MAQFSAQSVWEHSLTGRLAAFAQIAWENSLIARGLTAVGRFSARVFAGSFPGKVWYSDWPSAADARGSLFGRAAASVGGWVARVGNRVSPFLNATWESSLVGRIWACFARLIAPALSTSLFAQTFTGFAGQIDSAPAEGNTLTRRTSPVVYLLGTLLALTGLIPSHMTGLFSPTTLAIIGVWGLALLWFVLKVMDRDFECRASSAFVPLAAFLAFAAAATVQSVDPGASAKNLVIWLTAGLLFWMVQNVVRNSRDAAAFLGPILGAACLMTAWALYQYRFPPHIEEAWVDPEQGEVVRVFASMDNPNYLAEYMELLLPLGVALWFQQKRPTGRLIVALEVICLALALVLTKSRGGWLAAIAALGVLMLMRARRWSFMAILAGLAAIPFLPQSLINRFVSAFAGDTSSQYRVNLWRGVVDMIEKHWAAGVGLGAEAFAKGYQEFMLPAARAAHAHNTYLQMLAETGILGVLAVLWAVFAIVRRTFNTGISPRRAVLLAAVPAALIGLLIHGFAEHIWYNPKLLFAFWAVAGLGMGLAQGDREETAA